MLKIDVNKEHTNVEIVASLPELCNELSNAISAVNDRLEEQDPGAGYAFKLMFIKGFADGLVFNTDREHMEHYLAEADKRLKVHRRKREEVEKEDETPESTRSLGEILTDFMDFLKDHINPLQMNEQNAQEDDHETE